MYVLFLTETIFPLLKHYVLIHSVFAVNTTYIKLVCSTRLDNSVACL